MTPQNDKIPIFKQNKLFTQNLSGLAYFGPNEALFVADNRL